MAKQRNYFKELREKLVLGARYRDSEGTRYIARIEEGIELNGPFFGMTGKHIQIRQGGSYDDYSLMECHEDGSYRFGHAHTFEELTAALNTYISTLLHI